MEPSRVQRHRVHTDAIFDQLMEAHINSKCEKGGRSNPSSQEDGGLTLGNFGARTGLNWSESRVAREIAGLIGGFTQGQEDKLTQMRKNGRAVAGTLASTKEFNGRGNPYLFPHKSKQQIAAKLLDMFGYVKLKSIVPAGAEGAANGGRGGRGGSSSSSSFKVYVYQDGGGSATLEPAGGGATAQPTTSTTTSSAFEGSNNAGNGWRFSRAAAEYREILSVGEAGGGGGGGACGFDGKSNRFGDAFSHHVTDAPGLFSARAAGGEGAYGNWIPENSHLARAGGANTAVNGAGHACPASWSAPTPPPIPTRAQPRFGQSPAVMGYDCYGRTVECGHYKVDQPAWNGCTNKSAVFPGCFVPPSSRSSRRPTAQQTRSTTISGTPFPPGVPGLSDTMPRHSPLAVSSRFSNGRSTSATLPPPPPPPPSARPRERYFPPNDRFRKKPRIPVTTTMTGVAMRPPRSADDPTADMKAPPRTSFGPLLRRRIHHKQHSGTAAQGATTLFGNGPSMAAGATACPTTAGGSNEKISHPLKSFPASVSLAQQKSLRLAFGSALTEEAWLLGTSTLLDAELNLD